MADLLLKSGANPNITTNFFLYTPLHLAFKYDAHPIIIILLIKYGALVDLKDNEGKLPFNHAVSPELMKYALAIKEDLKKLKQLEESVNDESNQENSNNFTNHLDTKNNSILDYNTNNTNNTITDHCSTNRHTENKGDFQIYTQDHTNTKEKSDNSVLNTDREGYSEMNPLDTNK